jgi:hypothetical protein
MGKDPTKPRAKDDRLMGPENWTISDLIAQLSLDPDAWRSENPFSQDMRKCHAVLFDARRTRAEKATALSQWLSEFQPCLFGRMEAKQSRLEICLLTDNDLQRSDDFIRTKIQRDRLNWRRLATAGQSHGFLIVAVSETIALARPSKTLLDLAARLCQFYVGADEPDRIHLDELDLEIRTLNKTEWRRWSVGVNYFSAQGDGRWWRDHRMPGGIAFSMNSVGHMARARVEQELDRNPKLLDRYAEVPREKLVYWALRTAMKTVGPPEEGNGRGTWLVERGSFPEDAEPPGYEERRRYFDDLAAFSENRYRGLYHTDETIPSAYFDEGLWRREDLAVRDDLYFTYLHCRDDEDYLSMGLGSELERAAGGAQNKIP